MKTLVVGRLQCSWFLLAFRPSMLLDPSNWEFDRCSRHSIEFRIANVSDALWVFRLHLGDICFIQCCWVRRQEDLNSGTMFGSQSCNINKASLHFKNKKSVIVQIQFRSMSENIVRIRLNIWIRRHRMVRIRRHKMAWSRRHKKGPTSHTTLGSQSCNIKTAPFDFKHNKRLDFKSSFDGC